MRAIVFTQTSGPAVITGPIMTRTFPDRTRESAARCPALMREGRLQPVLLP